MYIFVKFDIDCLKAVNLHGVKKTQSEELKVVIIRIVKTRKEGGEEWPEMLTIYYETCITFSTF